LTKAALNTCRNQHPSNVPWMPESLHPKHDLYSSSRVAYSEFTLQTDRQTDGLTDGTRTSIAFCLIHWLNYRYLQPALIDLATSSGLSAASSSCSTIDRNLLMCSDRGLTSWEAGVGGDSVAASPTDFCCAPRSLQSKNKPNRNFIMTIGLCEVRQFRLKTSAYCTIRSRTPCGFCGLV